MTTSVVDHFDVIITVDTGLVSSMHYCCLFSLDFSTLYDSKDFAFFLKYGCINTACSSYGTFSCSTHARETSVDIIVLKYVISVLSI